jgi:GNAT superfamily N-acetyltransferase
LPFELERGQACWTRPITRNILRQVHARETALPSASDLIPAEPRSAFHTSGGLDVRVTADPNDELVDEFFEGYDRSFVLPNEKEERAGFGECLALNLPPHYEGLRARYGAFREIVLVAYVQSTKSAVGGANLICFPLHRDTARRSEIVLALNLNYLHVLPEHRGRGYFRRILDACEAAARRSFAADLSRVPVLVFLEQNDPLRMSAADYARDTEYSGIDQIARIGIWTRAGARIVDFPYVQPALSGGQEADRNLVLAVLGAGDSGLDACFFRDHLARFFGISVLKGRALEDDGAAWSQLEELRQRCAQGESIPLLDATPWLEQGTRPPGAPGGNLRQEVRAALRRC